MFPFVIKERNLDLSYTAVKAAMSRLPSQHFAQPLLSAKLTNLEAGIAGEERVASALNSHTFPMDHRILHDITLETSQTFQMDHIFITSSFTVVFETKNISGRLRFQENPYQLVRIKENGQADAYECPGAQVRRNAKLLEEWYARKNIPVPVFGVVVLAYPKQIVELAPKKTTVLFPSQIPSFIRKLPQKNTLTKERLHELAMDLKDSDRPYVPKPICDGYNIQRSDILTGVRCKSCGSLSMKKIPRSWQCKKCEHRDQFAHIHAIREWFLIVGEEMTNKDCRDFLHVDTKTATRLLQSANLICSGAKRNRTYKATYKTFVD